MCFRNGASQTVARRKFPQGNLKTLLTLLVVGSAFVASFLAGCSGGSKSGTPGTTTTPTPVATPTPVTKTTAVASIFWGARSRDVFSQTSSGFATAPSSALSAVLTLTPTSTATGATVLTATANRDTTRLAAYSSDPITLGTAVVGQVYALHVDFYAQTGATGSVVATADSIVGGGTVTSGGTLSILVTTTGRIQSVKVLGVGTAAATSSTLTVGQTANVLYTAYDGQNGTGNVVAVTPGSEFVTTDTGVNAVSIVANDQVQGVSPSAAANIIVSVDNVRSEAFPLKVVSTGVSLALAATLPSSVFGTPTAPIDSPGFPLTFTATVTGAPTGQSGVTFSLSSTALGTLSNTTANTTVFTPLVTSTSGTVTLTATSVYDPNITASVVITLESLVSIAVNETANGVVTGIPAGATFPVSINGTYQFNATVNYVPTGADTSVTWSAVSGTIDQNGLYTAPSTPPTGGTDTITVTSNYDPSKKFVFSVYVQAGTLPITVN